MIRTLLFGDWATKGVALFMALFLWTYLFWQKHDVGEIDVSLEVSVPSSEVASVEARDSNGNVIKQIRLRIVAPRTLAKDVGKMKISCKVTVPASAFTEKGHGTHSLTLGPDDLINLPPRFTVEFLPSPEITIRYWKYKTELVPVVFGPITEPAEGYEVVAKVIEPKQILVRLPANAQAPSELILREINLAGKRTPIQLVMQPLKPEMPERVTLPRPDVTVTIEIAPRPSRTEIRLKVQLLHEAPIPYSWSLNREEVRVQLTGVQEDLDRITVENSLAFVILKTTKIPEEKEVLRTGEYTMGMDEFDFRTSAELTGSLAAELLDEVKITFKKR